MSNHSSSINSPDESEHYSKFVPDLDTAIKEKIIEIPGAVDYIENLQRILKKLIKKIRKLKNKIIVS